MSPLDLRTAFERPDGSERLLRAIVDSMPTQIWFGRPDGSAEFMNQRCLDYTGLSADQALGWKWIDAVHPDDRPALLEHWQNLLRLGESGEIEARLRRADGEYRWFLLCAHPLHDASGSVLRWCGANTEIDDRKRAETETQGNEDRASPA
jgi:PAS domain S-box-containing protein